MTETREEFKARLKRSGAVRNLNQLPGLQAALNPVSIVQQALQVADLGPGAVQGAQTQEMTELVELDLSAIPVKIAQGNGLGQAIKDLSELEFVAQTPGGLKALAHGKLVRSRTSDLEELQGKLEVCLATLKSVAGGKDVKAQAAASKRALDLHDRTKTALGKLSHDLDSAGRGAQNMIEEKAISAYVRKHPNKARKDLEKAITIIEAAESVAGSVTPPGWGWIPGTLKLLTTIAERTASEVLISKQGDEYRATHTKGEGRAEHDKNPLLMAEMLVQQHKDNLKLLLRAAGIAAEEIKGWPFIEAGIETVIESVLDRRLDLAKQKLAAERGKTPERKGVVDTVFEGLKDDLQEKLLDPGTLAELMTETAKEVKDSAKTAGLELLLRGVIRGIISKIPMDPAQAVTGEQLTAEIKKIVDSQVPKEFFRAGTAQRPEIDFPRPTQDKDGNPVQAILSVASRHEDGRPFQWVRIGGQVGVLFIDPSDLEFLPDSDPGCPDPPDAIVELVHDVPEFDKTGRIIDEVRYRDKHDLRVDPGTRHKLYNVRIKDLWGWIDETTRVFTPEKPDESAFADWKGRFLTRTGFTEGGVPTSGTWYRPWSDKHLYVLDHGDGTMEWAHAQDLTANGPGMEYSVEKVVGDFARPHPTLGAST